ncbi:MAG: hypothetical protein IKA62_02140 [Clostridia bacterium]|nr:hypothetical protein [Clostridia bacterium]
MDEIKDLVCPICGEPTSVWYGNARKDKLCREHGAQLKEGIIATDGHGNFIDVKTKKIINKAFYEEKKPEPVKETKNGADELTCIICGEPSNGKHFCLKCYHEYKDHSVDIRITNCRETQIIDRYGNKTIKTKDGRFVRSLSEKIILDYFFDHCTRVVYEKTIPYINEKGENAELHPDFYLFDYDLYIEYNGLTNKSYLKKKDYANKIYQAKGYKVEILDANDIGDIEGTLDRVLEKYKK